MSRELTLPYLGIPPNEYDNLYFQSLVRSISIFMDNSKNPGEGRNTFIVLTDLQTDDSGLETGALFEQDGFVKITRTNVPHVRGSAGTGQVGSVTVSIS